VIAPNHYHFFGKDAVMVAFGGILPIATAASTLSLNCYYLWLAGGNAGDTAGNFF
jgi:hypothetical protein